MRTIRQKEEVFFPLRKERRLLLSDEPDSRGTTGTKLSERRVRKEDSRKGGGKCGNSNNAFHDCRFLRAIRAELPDVHC